MRCKLQRKDTGFSLLEVLMVLVIMGMVAGLVTVNVRSRMQIAKQNIARTEVAAIVDAVESFHLIYGRYPTDREGLEILTTRDAKTDGPLLASVPIDPWGHSYEYAAPGDEGRPYEVICLGADGVEGGEGANADVQSWNLKAVNHAP